MINYCHSKSTGDRDTIYKELAVFFITETSSLASSNDFIIFIFLNFTAGDICTHSLYLTGVCLHWSDAAGASAGEADGDPAGRRSPGTAPGSGLEDPPRRLKVPQQHAEHQWKCSGRPQPRQPRCAIRWNLNLSAAQTFLVTKGTPSRCEVMLVRAVDSRKQLKLCNKGIQKFHPACFQTLWYSKAPMWKTIFPHCD